MPNIKSKLIALGIILLILFLIASTIFIVLYKPTYKAKTGQGRFYLEFLKENSDPKLHTLWEQLWDATENVTVPKAILDEPLTDKELATKLIELITSYGFWVDDRGTNGQYSFLSEATTITIENVKYFGNHHKLKAELEVKLTKVFDQVYVEGKPRETINNINAYLYNTTKYGENSHMEGQTVYSTLIDKEAVCGGYARTFNTLALMAGIDSEITTGYLKGARIQERHAWNTYRINGSEYIIDITANITSNKRDKWVDVPVTNQAYRETHLQPEKHAEVVRKYDK